MEHKTAAKLDDVSIEVGNSEDRKVKHLTIKNLKDIDLGIVALRYPNIEKLDIMGCIIKSDPDLTPWVRKRNLVHVTCTTGVVYMVLTHVLSNVSEIKPVKILSEFIITW